MVTMSMWIWPKCASGGGEGARRRACVIAPSNTGTVGMTETIDKHPH